MHLVCIRTCLAPTVPKCATSYYVVRTVAIAARFACLARVSHKNFAASEPAK